MHSGRPLFRRRFLFWRGAYNSEAMTTGDTFMDLIAWATNFAWIFQKKIHEYASFQTSVRRFAPEHRSILHRLALKNFRSLRLHHVWLRRAADVKKGWLHSTSYHERDSLDMAFWEETNSYSKFPSEEFKNFLGAATLLLSMNVAREIPHPLLTLRKKKTTMKKNTGKATTRTRIQWEI